MKPTVGRPIEVEEVLTRSAGILWRTPAMVLPQAVILLPALLGFLALGSGFNPLGAVLTIILVILSVVFAVIVSGAYPFMVKAVVEGGQPNIAEALRKAYRRFWSIVGAGILVGLIVGLGFVALVVPGIVLATWYVYTIPAMMLEDKGVTAGMDASKAFGRDKKWCTFAILVVFVVVAVALATVGLAFSLASRPLGKAISDLLDIPFAAWASVTISYVYLRYGPASVQAPQEAPSLPAMPQPSPQPAVSADASVAPSPGRFCTNCGSPIKPGARFCTNCGKPV